MASTANIGLAASIWLGVALISGPVLGLCGGRVGMSDARPPPWAVVVPSAVLLSEAVWVAITWRVWVVPNPQDSVELAVVVVIALLAFALPWLTLRGTDRLAVAYLAVLALSGSGRWQACSGSSSSGRPEQAAEAWGQNMTLSAPRGGRARNDPADSPTAGTRLVDGEQRLESTDCPTYRDLRVDLIDEVGAGTVHDGVRPRPR